MGEIVFLSSYPNERRTTRKLFKQGAARSSDLSFVEEQPNKEKQGRLLPFKPLGDQTFTEESGRAWFVPEQDEGESAGVFENRSKGSAPRDFQHKYNVALSGEWRKTMSAGDEKNKKPGRPNNNIIDMRAYRRRKQMKSPRFYLPSLGSALQASALAFAFLFVFHVFYDSSNESKRGLAQTDSLTDYSARAHLNTILKDRQMIAGEGESSVLPDRSPDSESVKQSGAIKHLRKIRHSRQMISGERPSSLKYQGF